MWLSGSGRIAGVSNPSDDPVGPAEPDHTEQIPQRGRYPDPLTQELPQVPPQPEPGSGTLEYPQEFGEAAPATPPPPPPPPAADGGEPPAGRRGIGQLLRDPLSLALIVVIVVALTLAGVVGVELWARNKAADVVAQAAACVVEDNATATFGGATPFLWQHLNRDYTNISITTAGNRIRDIEGIKADIRIDDVRITEGGDTRGTMGSMQATVTWSADGIKRTVQQRGPEIVSKLQEQFSNLIPGQLLVLAQPLIASASASLVTDVTMQPATDSIELSGNIGRLSVAPAIEDGRITLTAKDAAFKIPILGEQPLPTEAFQPLVEQFTGQLADDLPLGLQPVSLDVTDAGVIAVFATTNATIPRNQSGCFDQI